VTKNLKQKRNVTGDVEVSTITLVKRALFAAAAIAPERMPGTVALRALVPEMQILLEKGYTFESIADMIAPHIVGTNHQKVRAAVTFYRASKAAAETQQIA
jgi:hypothetical protein